MAGKKACVIFTPPKEAEAKEVARRLTTDGYEVCSTRVTRDEATAVEVGHLDSLPNALRKCLEGADVCVILLGEDASADAELGRIAGIASDHGCRVVTVGGNPDDLPPELDDVIDGHLPSAESPPLIDVVKGQPDRIKTDNTPAAGRDPARVKCQ